MKYSKYHALGNDYLVIAPEDLAFELSSEKIKRICHRNFGIGSDGILFGPLPSKDAKFGLRIFNPDGSEAEKSGNGLRIFSRYLWDKKLVGEEEFDIDTLGGRVKACVAKSGQNVRLEMGYVSFHSDNIPVAGHSREVLEESITIDEQTFTFCAATIGNPHCVIQMLEVTPEIVKKYGPRLEVHPYFPNRTNVQFMKVLDRGNIQIEIWERGAGYTLASGSSSSAAAAVAHRLGLCDSSIAVHTPGGQIAIEISDDFLITMTGAVTKVTEGLLSMEIFE
ncbi:diaminopimelate epimerase [Nostocaceae cyanobacterium CENA357]|uniref:Diaminopimelate epimerase n=1 Tax=Atlanticothrix silvestris CENA357 TaxID=1725252 RepID=A0A8J7L5A1_9CYAN|nr:diaminopimelate epimerase [Atlanticothrix silvestris]MBH8552862.1 diaminopimelate epimerase [Atlanticothrix silvestris CENA357]